MTRPITRISLILQRVGMITKQSPAERWLGLKAWRLKVNLASPFLF